MPSIDRWTEGPSQILQPGPNFDIRSLDTRSTPGFSDGKKAGKTLMKEHGKELADLQEQLYANGRTGDSRAVLLVLQGMDTAGKGGIGRHVLGMVDPQGVQIRGFGVPTEEEAAEHFLWRIRKALPSAGRIGVFDRSHYEDVLVVRVHGLISGDPWEERYAEINAFEQECADQGITVVKCALVISRDQQLDRLSKRLTRPDKHWKYSTRDLDERAHWDAYLDAYQAAIPATHTETAPWHVIPADRKWYARLAVTQVLIDTMRALDLTWPPGNFDLDTEVNRLNELRAQAGLKDLVVDA